MCGEKGARANLQGKRGPDRSRNHFETSLKEKDLRDSKQKVVEEKSLENGCCGKSVRILWESNTKWQKITARIMYARIKLL